MGDAGIDADHEIEAAHKSRGLAEIGEVGGEVDNIGTRPQHGLIVRSRILLEADEGRVDVEDA